MFLFYVFWPRGMWDLNFPTRNQTHTSCIGSLDRWAYREVLQMCLLLCQRRLGRERCLSIFNTQVHLFICLLWGCIYSVISWLREIMSIEFVLGKRQVQKGIFFFFFFFTSQDAVTLFSWFSRVFILLCLWSKWPSWSGQESFCSYSPTAISSLEPFSHREGKVHPLE